MLVICNKANHPDCPKCGTHDQPHKPKGFFISDFESIPCTQWGECFGSHGEMVFESVRCVNIKSKTGRKICEDLGYDVD